MFLISLLSGVLSSNFLRCRKPELFTSMQSPLRRSALLELNIGLLTCVVTYLHTGLLSIPFFRGVNILERRCDFVECRHEIVADRSRFVFETNETGSDNFFSDTGDVTKSFGPLLLFRERCESSESIELPVCGFFDFRLFSTIWLRFGPLLMESRVYCSAILYFSTTAALNNFFSSVYVMMNTRITGSRAE